MQKSVVGRVHLVFVLGLFAGYLLQPMQSAQAVPLTSFIDQFAIIKDGATVFNDTFSDGVPPPTSPDSFNSATFFDPPYITNGQFTEASGKASMSSETHGAPVFPQIIGSSGATLFTGAELVRRHSATVRSSSNPASNFGLNIDSTFEVLGLFDLIPPVVNIPGRSGGNYGIGLNDFGTSFDRMRLSVLGLRNGEMVVQFFRNDTSAIPSVNTLFERTALETSHDQIVLRLSRNNTVNNDIQASFAYVDEANVGLDISDSTALGALTFTTFATTGTIFGTNNVTRAIFRQQVIDADQQFNFAVLTAESPTSISQTVYTGVAASILSFNYRFDTITGTLDIMLGGTLLGTINAPSSVSSSFASASFLIDGLLLDQDLDLKFTVDGLDGSTVLLDAINFAGIQNGDFGTQDLTDWEVTTSGEIGVQVLTIVSVSEPLSVPEPPTLAIFGLGLVGLAFMRRRRKPA